MRIVTPAHPWAFIPAGTLMVMLLLLAGSLPALPACAGHSDVIISRSNGVLRVDQTIHTGDVRENGAAGNATVWAMDNPGFAGSGFRFQDEFLFDITGPLRRWDGTNWSTANVDPEFTEFVKPGPFGDPLHSVTITRATTFAAGYQISQAGTRGSLHTHFVSILRATNGVAPAVGAYSFPLTIRSPQYTSAPPVHLVFNNGLSETNFEVAVEQFTAALRPRLAVTPGASNTVAPSFPMREDVSYQVEAAPVVSGPWSNAGQAVSGNGGVRGMTVSNDAAAQFFRIRSP